MANQHGDTNQLPLFGLPVEDLENPSASHRPSRFGLAAVSYKDVSGILTKPKGFMAGYDFTINPYSGCAFGCAYCYAASFAPDERSADSWGEWVMVKENALG